MLFYLNWVLGVVEVVDETHAFVYRDRAVQLVEVNAVVFQVLRYQLQQRSPLRDDDCLVAVRKNPLFQNFQYRFDLQGILVRTKSSSA